MEISESSHPARLSLSAEREIYFRDGIHRPPKNAAGERYPASVADTYIIRQAHHRRNRFRNLHMWFFLLSADKAATCGICRSFKILFQQYRIVFFHHYKRRTCYCEDFQFKVCYAREGSIRFTALLSVFVELSVLPSIANRVICNYIYRKKGFTRFLLSIPRSSKWLKNSSSQCWRRTRL